VRLVPHPDPGPPRRPRPSRSPMRAGWLRPSRSR
jgi:hypothetical protein